MKPQKASVDPVSDVRSRLETAAHALGIATGATGCAFFIAGGRAEGLSYGPFWQAPQRAAWLMRPRELYFPLDPFRPAWAAFGGPQDSAWRPWCEALGADSLLAFIVGPPNSPLAIALLAAEPAGVFGPLTLEFVGLQAELIAVAWGASASPFQDVGPLHQRNLELTALYTLTAAAMEPGPIEALLSKALAAMLQVTHLPAGLMFYRAASGGCLLGSSEGLPSGLYDRIEAWERAHGIDALYRLLAFDDPPSSDLESRALWRDLRAACASWIVLPLQSHEKLQGLLLLAALDYAQLSDERSRMLATIANQLILAIERSLAFSYLEELVDSRTAELRESAAQLEATVAELRRMDQFKNDFLSNVSHELRTPLSGIIGYGEFLAEEVYGELNLEQKQVLDQLVTNSYQLMELINNLLDLSRLDAGKLQLYCEPIELGTLLQQSIGKVTPQAIQKDLILDLPAGPGPVVEVDPGRIVQVIVNLLSNAIKFTAPGGTIRITVETRGRQTIVRVSDTGIGISAEHLPKLFQRFAQGDSSTTRQFGGTGLGLAISRELIELHGQEIWAESETGRGSTFSFSLPLWAGGLDAHDAPRSPVELSQG